jgi:threonine/homoserine/homoserine lactone efflux protein
LSIIDTANLALFLAAALVIAVTPGPGIFYVAARTLAGGRGECFASTLGTGVGGLVHVAGGAIGVSALIMASAQGFTIVKFVGALYLVWLGIKTLREAGLPTTSEPLPTGARRAFRDGILVEALNPKTAAFFLAFIPQFIAPESGHAGLQFLSLGMISVALNTTADAVVVQIASSARGAIGTRPRLLRRLRQAAGVTIAGLGVSLALTRRPALP